MKSLKYDECQASEPFGAVNLIRSSD